MLSPVSIHPGVRVQRGLGLSSDCVLYLGPCPCCVLGSPGGLHTAGGDEPERSPVSPVCRSVSLPAWASPWVSAASGFMGRSARIRSS